MDTTPDEAIEEILGVALDRPATAEPCWEEKHGPAVTSYDPDHSSEDMASAMRDVLTRLARIETAINQVGSQTSWLVTAFAEARAAFMAMSQQLSEKGPLGLIRMMSGSKKKGDGNDPAN